MRIVILLCFFISFCLTARSQQPQDVNTNNSNLGIFFQSVGGVPFTNGKNVSFVEGSPFFKTEWKACNLTSIRGASFKNVPVKLNLLENQIHFKDPAGNEFIASTGIKEITIKDAADNENFHFINSIAFPALKNIKPKWYLSLFNDKVWLLKDFQKTITEQRPYGSATTEQRIETNEMFYIVHNDMVHRVKAIKEVPSLLQDQKEAIALFIKNQNKSFSFEERLAEVVAHYNSLIK